jgi:tetrahydromethanopterin S-methyltransferase subunit G
MSQDEKRETKLFSNVDLEPEVVVGPSLDEKLDKILTLLEKNAQENDEIKMRLDTIEADLGMLQAAYQQHGKALGELAARVDALVKEWT